MAAQSWSRYEALVGGVSAGGFPARGSSREGRPGGRRSSEEGREHARGCREGWIVGRGHWIGWLRGVAWRGVASCGVGQGRGV